MEDLTKLKHLASAAILALKASKGSSFADIEAAKMTPMPIMADTQPPTPGKLIFRGKDVTGVAVQKRNVSMVCQQFINYPNFNVHDNIASPCGLQA